MASTGCAPLLSEMTEVPSRVELLSVLGLRRGYAPYELEPFKHFGRMGIGPSPSSTLRRWKYALAAKGRATHARKPMREAVPLDRQASNRRAVLSTSGNDQLSMGSACELYVDR